MAFAGDVAITVEKVSHAYLKGAQAGLLQTLREVSLEIRRGEMVCLIGPSGCGKSTLLNIIGGLIQPSTGVVKVDGRVIRGPTPNEIAFVFQDNTLFPWSTILENVKVALEFQGVPATEREGRARTTLAAVGLKDFADHYPHQLSGGMKQRASLARALALQTGILLMDEPFAALDEQTRTYLGEELSRLLAKTGKTIIFVTHSLSEAVFLADRVIVMTARPAAIKATIAVAGAHPRGPAFMASPRFAEQRNELYALLRDEIEKTVGGLVGEEPEEAAPPMLAEQRG
ncbi:MAG: sulfate transporter ATP-binding protein [Rhodospirillales bacterium]|jgi:NitT/TauT family transport system ATP-binding protein|nr:sulfate transporter ATP-binding protein [Rhodospirillales bacterium]